MDKFLKRKVNNDDDDNNEDVNTKKKSKSIVSTSKIPLIVLPGASGRLSQSMQSEVLNKFQNSNLTVIKKDSINWNKYAAGNPSNITEILNLIPSDDEFYLLGNSFGNRVICEFVSNSSNCRNCRGIILCGYPLYGEKNNEDRVNQLKKIPKHMKLLMISGNLDDFLNQNYLNEKGEKLMRKQFTDLSLSNDHSKLIIVENGLHDLPKTKGKNAKETTKNAALLIVNEIKNFCT